MSTPAPLDRKGLEEKLGAELAAFVEEFRAIADRWDKATDPDEDAKLRAEGRDARTVGRAAMSVRLTGNGLR